MSSRFSILAASHQQHPKPPLFPASELSQGGGSACHRQGSCSKQLQLLNRCVGCLRLAIGENLHLAKLLVGDAQYPNITKLSHKRLHPPDMHISIFATRTVPKIDGKLKHGKPVGHDAFAEQRIRFSFLLCIRWQVEKHKDPHDSVFTEAIHRLLHFRIHHLPYLPRKAVDQRSSRLGHRHHHGTALPTYDNLLYWQTQQLPFQVGSQLAAIGATFKNSYHQFIHVGTIRLHDVVGQAVSVVAVVMVNTESGQQYNCRASCATI